ncbi:MAG: nucleotidyltransferase family protein [Clostridia bacterium]|nr:nucleotidyltransferase family protein [Clostridia bacterium]
MDKDCPMSKFSYQNAQMLFALINSVISRTEMSKEQKSEFCLDGINNLVALADMHKLLPIVTESLLYNNLLAPFDKQAVALRRIQYKEVCKNELREHEFENICGALETAGVEFVPLKGSVIRRFYPEPWMRTSCDIDILVRKSDVEKACSVLSEKAGYEIGQRSFHDVKIKTPSKINLELHFDLIEEKVKDNVSAILSDAWNYTKNVEGCEFRKEFTNEFFMLYHIIHMAKHMMIGGCGIRPFIDLWYIRKNFESDQSLLDSMLQKSNIVMFYEMANRLCDVWFDGAPHNELTYEMQEFIIRGGIFGTTESAAIVNQSKGKDKKRQLFRLAFLPMENMKLIYPNLNKRPWLLPFYHIKRWFRVFNRSKREKVNSYIGANDKVSQKSVDRVSRLMNDLELK